MISVTFPDGASRQFEPGLSGADIAKSISPSLLKRTVAMMRDGVLSDLADPIDGDARLEFLGRDDPRALELIRHDAAHVLAEAVQSLWPGTQVTIGPVIDNGFYYDFDRADPFTPEDFAAIEKRMREIIAKDRPFTKEFWTRDEAKAWFKDRGETYKIELVDMIKAGEDLKIYKQGDWLDLCRGPHMTSTGKVGAAFKLMKVAGAYWRGDSNRPMLQRIYATAFAKQDELDAYLKQLEEAERRDHRRLGREMDLFHFQEEGPGTVFWHPKGWTLFQTLISYMRRRQEAAGYIEVNTPQVLDRALWETSGHWQTYRENMFITTTEDDRVFALKPMNCPGHVQIFKNGLKSYRDLPLKIAEFGIVHRYEPSGAIHGIMRVRAFTQDDAHIFCTEDQIQAESLKINDMILSIYKDFGFEDIVVKLSTRPEKRVGSDEAWDKAEAALGKVLDAIAAQGLKTDVNPGEGAFYGPKLEYTLRDAIGREWQCGTTQVDFNLPGRFGAFYIDEHSDKVTPVMIHRAMFGSLERFTGILIENFAGHLPLWLAPLQVVVATITSDADDYALEVMALARKAGLRVEGDLRNEKINYKVREHSLAKVPVLMVVGRKEATERLVSIRRLGSQAQTSLGLDEALGLLAGEATAPDSRRAQTDAVEVRADVPVVHSVNQIRTCIFGNGVLDENTKPEHILLNALGGRMTTRNVDCSKHNGIFGSTIDKALTAQVNVIRNLLQMESGTGKEPPALKAVQAGTQKINMLGDGQLQIVAKPFELKKRDDGGWDINITARSEEHIRKIVPQIAAATGISEESLVAQLVNADATRIIKRPDTVHQKLSFGGPDAIRSMVKSAMVLWATQVGNDEVRSPPYENSRNFVLQGSDAFVRNDSHLDARFFDCVDDIKASFGPLFNLIYVRSNDSGRVLGHFTLYNMVSWQFTLAQSGGSPNKRIALVSNPLNPFVWSSEAAERFDISFDWLDRPSYPSNDFSNVQARVAAVMKTYFDEAMPKSIGDIVTKVAEELGFASNETLLPEEASKLISVVSHRAALHVLNLPYEEKLTPEQISRILDN